MNEPRSGRPGAAEVARRPALLLGTGLGVGLVPVAPGTAGTVLAVPLYLLLAAFGPAIYVAGTLLAAVFGVVICGVAARELGVHDHPAIVWDEIAGFLVTMLPAVLLPDLGLDWLVLLAGFLLFRLFDIAKPWPIGVLDRRLRGGLGVIADDLLAGVYAAAVLLAAGYMGWLGA